MHFHLPKPLHGWREFAGEVGIIVIGVLIALGAEQVVEAIHWRGQVADTRQSLNAELAEARFAAAEQRINHDCNTRKLAALDSITDQSEVPALQVILFGLRPWSTSTWEAATASGAIAHIPLEERNRYAGLFGMIKVLGDLHRQAFETTNDLRTLAHHRRLTDVARDRLQADIARLRGLSSMLDLGSAQFIRDSDPLHLRMTSGDQAGLTRDREFSRTCRMPDSAAA